MRRSPAAITSITTPTVTTSTLNGIAMSVNDVIQVVDTTNANAVVGTYVVVAGDLTGGVETAAVVQPVVEDRDVGPSARHEVECRLDRRRQPEQGQIGLVGQQGGQSLSDDGMVLE